MTRLENGITALLSTEDSDLSDLGEVTRLSACCRHFVGSVLEDDVVRLDEDVR